uniref:Uncharacterized protein n=1 Tax=Anguilla anguilla TaxID=7936 RepID=A0A0E9SWE5_ANGAN
MRGTLVTIAFN